MLLQPVPWTAVRLADRFWSPRVRVNRETTLPHSFDQLVESGTRRNFELACAGASEGFTGYVFQDSDVYKTLEAVALSLGTHPDPELDARADELIALVAAAQLPDGYLDTHFQLKGLDRRWTNLRDLHELYCAGHLFEAAVAHKRATGKDNLLTVALRFADHLAERFGEDRLPGYPGHPEAELALLKLWRLTGDARWFELARFFVDHRGEQYFAREHNTPLEQYDGRYWQDNVPLREHREIVGHAVRAGYLFSAVTELAGETGDPSLLRMLRRVWRNTTQRRMYLTGGIGSSGHNEGFTTDFDLPNLTAYQETCASISLAMWAQRLGCLTGEAHFADHVELALYNGVLAGVSLDGTKFFYDNPLASRGYHHRREWFGCACCPPNLARTLAGLGGYAYSEAPGELRVELYLAGGVDCAATALDVATDYPWDGRVELTVRRAGRCRLLLRVPGWCQGATVSLPATIEQGYFVLDRDWLAGETVVLELPMPVRRIAADPRVAEDRGCLAVMRGPLVYCAEDCDHEVGVHTLGLPPEAELTARWEPDLLGGVVVLRGTALAAAETEWGGGLYRQSPPPRAVPVTLVPYYAWDNRAGGGMVVWLPTAPPPPLAGGPERRAQVAVSFQVGHSQPHGLNDGVEPAKSNEPAEALCHFWPHKGGEEWAEYTWPTSLTLASARVYWYDDSGRGGCRPPAAWRLEWLDGDAWRPVDARGSYDCDLDRWCEVSFAPVTTTRLRLVVQQQEAWSAGMHEWQVAEADDDE